MKKEILTVQNLEVSIKHLASSCGSSPAGGAEKRILSGVDFSISEGETVVLLGRNGAGKSTIVSSLMGDPRFNVSGKVKLEGADLLKLSTDQRVQKGLFMTFQNPVETPGISTTEIIRSSLEEKKGGFVPIDKVREKFTNTAQRLGENIWFFEREANVGFSGGEKKKNELIQALALKPRLLMLDELDSGLDLDSSDEISKILAEYQQETGCSYLIISHNLRVLHHLEISQAILLEKGHIVMSGESGLVKRVEKQGIRAILSEVSDSRGCV